MKLVRFRKFVPLWWEDVSVVVEHLCFTHILVAGKRIPIANIRTLNIGKCLLINLLQIYAMFRYTHTHVTQNATGTSSVQPFCPFCSIQCAIRPFLTLFPKGFSELMQSACLLCSITCELLRSIDPCVRFLSVWGLYTILVFTTVHAAFWTRKNDFNFCVWKMSSLNVERNVWVNLNLKRLNYDFYGKVFCKMDEKSPFLL